MQRHHVLSKRSEKKQLKVEKEKGLLLGQSHSKQGKSTIRSVSLKGTEK